LVQQESINWKDHRLSRQVDFSAHRVCLKEVLAELSVQSKVSLKAGLNQQDWQVRDLLSSTCLQRRFHWVNSWIQWPEF
jgi:hypothetical protein